MTTTNKLGWGFLSTANIGRKVKRAIDQSSNGRVVAVASRKMQSAQTYIREISNPSNPDEKIEAYGSYDDLFNDPNVDIVYIPIPSGIKKSWCIKAANKKKHILCEKPFSSAKEVEEITEACRQNGVCFLDGTMFVHNPRTYLIKDIVQSQELGQISHVNSEFCWYVEGTTNTRVIKELEPLGVLGDLGWYTAKSILIAYNFELPQKVMAFPLFKNDTTYRVHATLWFSGDRMATLTCSFDHSAHQVWEILGSKKALTVDGFVSPWTAEAIYFPNVKELPELDISIREGSGLLNVIKVSFGAKQEVRMVEELVRLAKARQSGKPEEERENRWMKESIATQCLLDAVFKSAQTGQVVDL